MDEAKRKRLEAAGWTKGDHGDFLGLTNAERRHVELRIALAAGIRRLRAETGQTSRALDKLIESTQSWVVKAETGTVEVSLDLMFRAFFAAGGTLEDLAAPKHGPARPEVQAAPLPPKSKPKRLATQGG